MHSKWKSNCLYYPKTHFIPEWPSGAVHRSTDRYSNATQSKQSTLSTGSIQIEQVNQKCIETGLNVKYFIDEITSNRTLAFSFMWFLMCGWTGNDFCIMINFEGHIISWWNFQLKLLNQTHYATTRISITFTLLTRLKSCLHCRLLVYNHKNHTKLSPKRIHCSYQPVTSGTKSMIRRSDPSISSRSA